MQSQIFQILIREKLHKALLCKKVVRKMMMKLTPEKLSILQRSHFSKTGP